MKEVHIEVTLGLDLGLCLQGHTKWVGDFSTLVGVYKDDNNVFFEKIASLFEQVSTKKIHGFYIVSRSLFCSPNTTRVSCCSLTNLFLHDMGVLYLVSLFMLHLVCCSCFM
jgi:hypothetical protein